MQLARAAQSAESQPTTHRADLLAGTGFDLSGELACAESGCVNDDAEALLRRTWHYFDRVIVRDYFTGPIVAHSEHSERLNVNQVGPMVDLLLHLRALHAEDAFEFRLKRPPYWTDQETAAVSLRLPPETQQRFRECTELFEKEASIGRVTNPTNHHHAHGAPAVIPDGSELWFLEHPSVHHMKLQVVPSEALAGRSDAQIRNTIAYNVAHMIYGYLLADIGTASDLNTSLAAPTSSYEMMLAPAPGMSNPSRVAFNLDLPFVPTSSMADLMDYRNANPQDFESFRHALRIASAERLRQGEEAPTTIANEIYSDVIDPELRRITGQMQRAVARRREALLGAGVATFVAVFGLLIRDSNVATLGAGLVAERLLSARSTQTTLTDPIRDSDMFFLFNAAERDH